MAAEPRTIVLVVNLVVLVACAMAASRVGMWIAAINVLVVLGNWREFRNVPPPAAGSG